MASTETPASRQTWALDLVEIYERRFVEFVRLAYLLTSSRAVAEELTQDTFMAVHHAWSDVERPEAYIRAALLNRCRSWFRRSEVEQRHRPSAPDPIELGADELWDALAALPYRRRAAIVLRFYEDLPDADIAAALGCAQATVRSLIHRGLAQLRKEVEQ